MSMSAPESCFLSVIVPTFREAENLRLLIPRIAKAASSPGLRHEIIIVDDDSRDGTEQAVSDLAATGHPVRLVTRVALRGLSSAVIRGFREAHGEILCCMDADLSHPPEAILRMLDVLRDSSVEFVLGSRYVEGGSTEAGWGLFRWLNSKTATILAKPFTSVRDPMSGFFTIRRSVFERAADLNPVGFKIGLELIVKCGCKEVREVPIHFADRALGESKLSFREQLNYLKHLKRLFDFKYGQLAQFAQFCFVGTTGLIVDLMMFALTLRLGLMLVVARALGIWIAMTWNFWLNRRLTFSYSRTERLVPQYLRYLASCLLGGAVSWSAAVILATEVVVFQQHLLLAAIVGILAGTIVNFGLSRRWVFRRTPPPARAASFSSPEADAAIGAGVPQETENKKGAAG